MADFSTDWLTRMIYAMIEWYWCRCRHPASAWPSRCRVSGDECVSGVCEGESISTDDVRILFNSLLVFLINVKF